MQERASLGRQRTGASRGEELRGRRRDPPRQGPGDLPLELGEPLLEALDRAGAAPPRGAEVTDERARLYGRRALDALAPFPAGKAKAALGEAVEFAIARAY